MLWVISHVSDLLELFGAIVVICSFIVKITPTQKDDTVWAKVLKYLDYFSIFLSKADEALIAKAQKKAK